MGCSPGVLPSVLGALVNRSLDRQGVAYSLLASRLHNVLTRVATRERLPVLAVVGLELGQIGAWEACKTSTWI